MRKRPMRLICLSLALMLVFAVFSCALAVDEWNCDSCGLTGITTNFCPNCGAAAPPAVWVCDQCGQQMTGNFCSNCGEQRPQQDQSVQAVPQQNPPQDPVDDDLEQIPGESDRVKVVASQVQAVGYIVNKKEPDRWLPENAADGNETTCWQFSKKKNKLGKAWLDLYYSKPQSADAIWFKNGFWSVNTAGEDEYAMNARPKEIRLEFLYSGESSYRDALKLMLQDDLSRRGWQRFDIGHRENITAVRLTVLSAYEGYRYPNDVCLSEVMLVRNAPASTAREAGTVIPRIYEATVGPRQGTLLNKLSTRSGPGTEYDEPGTFFGNNWSTTTVTVRGKSFDNSIWWVLVEFSAKGGKYRVWTGEKRVNVNLDLIPEIYAKGQGTVDPTSETYRGPGLKYAKANLTINTWQDVLAFGRENGFVEIEYVVGKKHYRLWVPESVAHIDWQ